MKGKVLLNPRGFSKGGEVGGHAAFQPQQLG